MQKECKTAIFNFRECDKDLIDTLAEYIDENAKKIWDFFEVSMPKEKPTINIIPTKKEYDDLYRSTRGLDKNSPVEKWKIGNCRNGVITYLSLHDYKNTSHAFDEKYFDKALNYFQKTILHEYVHFANEIFNKIHSCTYTEKYLVEGIATYLSGQKDGFLISLSATKEQILNKDKFFYDDYYLLTKYFVEHYDKEYVLNVFQNSKLAEELLNNELYEKSFQYYEKNELENSDI